MLVDRVDDLRPHRNRQRVPHAFDHQKSGAGDRGGGILAALGAYQRIDGAVNHQRGGLDRCQPLLAAARRQDGAELPPDAGRIEAAFEGALGARPVERLVFREAAGAQDLPGLRMAGKIFFLAGRWRRHQHRGGLAGRRRIFRIAGRRHDRGQRPHPLGERDRHFLRDHATHRCADQMCRLDAERIHQADHVERHVVELVGGLDRDLQETQLEQFERRQALAAASAWWTCRCRGCRTG